MREFTHRRNILFILCQPFQVKIEPCIILFTLLLLNEHLMNIKLNRQAISPQEIALL